ncbi:MAG: NAD-dependent succinate-semialdehyde dehydrogenase [Gammaproteobacteria bacterium]|nr:NAD-dependent succinate-semialdehyde dehydrogenase [Gammaproteobacteria bacterium]NNJ90139.1 NAD-dependent succinate-semialdehyde dehydrogenase [Gammaproteobacteria bacterium]
MIISINPASGQTLNSFSPDTPEQLETKITECHVSFNTWRQTSLTKRSDLLRSVAKELKKQQNALALQMTAEMGKLFSESLAEIGKCAWVCEYYAEQAEAFLGDEIIESDASQSMVIRQPLGTVLAIMPWNFPFWQVFRCVAPALMAGNTVLLKHASNVPGCAQAIEKLFQDADMPQGLFHNLVIPSSQVGDVIRDNRVNAVSLTGSESAGRSVAAVAGENLKKTVLELGGSDAFVVLEDADIEQAIGNAMTSRFLNCGQSCIAAKRFIVVKAIADEFVEQLQAAIKRLKPGNPIDKQTTLAPMAREDLREAIHQQVLKSVELDATLLCGGKPVERNGFFYEATLLDNVKPGMPAYNEELFGPVAAVIRVADESQALTTANDSVFGLGGSVWTEDDTRGENFARQLECGCAFVNGMVKSDPRLPFGGIKNSGYGRELSLLGLHEFTNAKTIWIR